MCSPPLPAGRHCRQLTRNRAEGYAHVVLTPIPPIRLDLKAAEHREIRCYKLEACANAWRKP
jgi:hypothetical protein